MLSKKDLKEKVIKYRSWLFEQYCRNLITLDEYARRMSEVEIEDFGFVSFLKGD